MDTKPFTKPLYINVYNFEDSKFQDNRYVLTSPRSLEACDDCRVKCYLVGVPFFGHRVSNEQSLLRQVIIPPQPADLLYKPLSEFQDELDGKISFEQILERYNVREQRRLGKLSAVRQRRTDIVDFQNSSGSTPEPEITSDENEEGESSEFHADTERTKWAVRGNDMNSTLIRDNNENTISKKFLDLDVSVVEKADSEKSEKSDGENRRSRPVTPTSSHRSDTTWTERDLHSADRNKDGRLTRHLTSSELSITSRDQKIIAALIRKEEDDLRREKLRRLAHVAWEDSHERARRRQEQVVAERKDRVAGHNRSRERMRTENVSGKMKELDAELKLKREKSLERDSKWEKSMEKIHDKSMQQLIERRQQELERKKSQDQRKTAREKELNKYHKMVDQYQTVALERAGQKKNEQLMNRTTRVVEKNKTEKQKQQERLARVEREKKALEESMRSSITHRHSRAEENVESLENQRLRQLSERRQASEERLKSSKSAVGHREKVMTSYFDDLSQYQKMRVQQADEIHNQTIEKKKTRAAEERVKWEELQKKNFTKVKLSEMERKRDVIDAIELKDIRSKRVLESKETAAQQLRTLAYNSSLLRDQLRERYNKDSFDKKCQKVELDVRMGLGGI